MVQAAELVLDLGVAVPLGQGCTAATVQPATMTQWPDGEGRSR
jgi:hypothetical protein